MVCSISPYYTDEELIETIHLALPNYDGMWLYDWEHILSCIKDKGEFFNLTLTFGDGSKRKMSIDKITGGIIFID